MEISTIFMLYFVAVVGIFSSIGLAENNDFNFMAETTLTQANIRNSFLAYAEPLEYTRGDTFTKEQNIDGSFTNTLGLHPFILSTTGEFIEHETLQTDTEFFVNSASPFSINLNTGIMSYYESLTFNSADSTATGEVLYTEVVNAWYQKETQDPLSAFWSQSVVNFVPPTVTYAQNSTGIFLKIEKFDNLYGTGDRLVALYNDVEGKFAKSDYVFTKGVDNSYDNKYAVWVEKLSNADSVDIFDGSFVKGSGTDIIENDKKGTFKLVGSELRKAKADFIGEDKIIIHNKNGKKAFIDFSLADGIYTDSLVYNSNNKIKTIDRYMDDYRSLLQGESISVDPVFGGVDADGVRVWGGVGSGSSCIESGFTKTNGGFFLILEDSADTVETSCNRFVTIHDVSNIPDDANITNVEADSNRSGGAGSIVCDIDAITSDPNTTSATTLWTNIASGTSLVTSSTFCTTSDLLDMGASADTAVKTALTSATDEFYMGIKFTTETRGATSINTYNDGFGNTVLSVTYTLPPDPPKQVGATVTTTTVPITWLAGELNGDTHSTYEVKRYNGTSSSWDQLVSQVAVNYTDSSPQNNSTAMYRVFDTGAFGRLCPQFVMNSTVVTNLQSNFPYCFTTNDQGLQDNDSTVTGTETYTNSTGTIYKTFDGLSYDTVPIETDYDYEYTSPFSVCVEAVTTSIGSIEGYVMKSIDTTTAVGWKLYKASANNVIFKLADGTNQYSVTGSDPTDGVSDLICGTYSGNSNQNGLKIYTNGVLTATGTSSAISSTILNNVSVIVGAESDAGNPYIGSFRNVIISDAELDANEVEQLYQERIDTSGLLFPPDQVTGLGVTTISTTQLDLAWTEPADNGYAITGYKIERESPVGGGWSTLVADTGTTAVAYSDTSLSTGTQFNYRVSAISSAGTGDASTADNDWTLPDVPTSLTATTFSDDRIDLAWTAPSGTVTGYFIEYESPSGGGWVTLVANTGTTAVTYSHTSLTSNTDFNYRVSAINLGGTGAVSNEDNAWTLPDPPTNLVPTTVAYDQINLTWDAPTVDVSAPPVTGYFIEFETPSGGGWGTLVANTGTTDTNYSHTSLAGDTEYNYRVSAIVVATTDPSTTALNRTLVTPITDLAGVYDTGAIDVDLTWSTAESPTGYGIFRSCTDGLGLGWVTLVANTGTTAVAYTDSALCIASYHAYNITAWNSAGESDWSNMINVTTISPVAGTITVNLPTHIIGNVFEINVTAVMNTVFPNVTSVDRVFVSGVDGDPINPETIALLNNNSYNIDHRLWAQFVDADTPLKVSLEVTNATGIKEYINSTTTAVAVEYIPNYLPSIQGNYFVNYTHSRNSVGTEVDLKINRLDIAPVWQIECNYRDELFGDGDWVNLTQLGAWEVNKTVNPIANSYIQCYNDELLFTTVSFGSTNATLALVNFTDQLGSFFGVPLPFLFVIFLAAIFTGRSAPTGIVFIVATIGTMGLMGYFPDPVTGNNMITGAVWGMLILITSFGVFMGKRFFVVPLTLFVPHLLETYVISQQTAEQLML